ncbi:hypothetical protein IBX73_05630 [candidate division WOR-3 bacterium]|nr:hypothetical protein [candidate division WOR-3 bacterium]
MNMLLCLVAIGSAQFLRLTPGVVAQGLGGASVVVNEGLPLFHNPAYARDMTFNFTLSRWLYSTNHLAAGATYEQYLFGISYLNYGQIQGYDSLGNQTTMFTPYDMCIGVGRKLGPVGLTIKGFSQRIGDENLYGLCGSIGAHYSHRPLQIGTKVDNLGKEFSQNATIPAYVVLGLKYSVTTDLDVLAEAKSSPFEVNSGVSYSFQGLSFLAGLKYLQSGDQTGNSEPAVDSYDFSYTGGVLIEIEEYWIGYSIVYSPLGTAHQFSVTLVPHTSN